LKRLPLHIDRPDLSIRNGELIVGDEPISEIATSAGSTPFYFYSEQLLVQRLSMLRELMPARMGLSYSIKANPHAGLVRLLSGDLNGLDVASVAEMHLALSTGLAPGQVTFAGPGKTDAELHAACEAGVVISVESAGELKRVTAIAKTSGRRPPVLLRLNPAFQLRGSGMKMSSGPQAFGVDAEEAAEVLGRFHSEQLDFRGFHLFAGSQCLFVDAIEAMLLAGLDLMASLSSSAPRLPKLLLFGGGFGVPYFAGDRHLDVQAIGEVLGRVDARAAELLPDARLQLELGRYLVAEAGFYVSRVVDRKRSRGRVFLITDGGMNHNLAASGNLGQVVRRDFPVLIGNRAGEQPTETVTVAGPLCTPLDILADQTMLPRAGPGDLVVLLQAGAYGLSASPVDFLGHPRPLELLG